MNFIFKSCLFVALAMLIFAVAPRATAQSDPVTNQSSVQTAPPASVPTMSAAPAFVPKPSVSYNADNLRQRPYLLALIVLLLAIGLVYVWKRRRQPV
jgi:hypothetical protein